MIGDHDGSQPQREGHDKNSDPHDIPHLSKLQIDGRMAQNAATFNTPFGRADDRVRGTAVVGRYPGLVSWFGRRSLLSSIHLPVLIVADLRLGKSHNSTEDLWSHSSSVVLAGTTDCGKMLISGRQFF